MLNLAGLMPAIQLAKIAFHTRSKMRNSRFIRKIIFKFFSSIKLPKFKLKLFLLMKFKKKRNFPTKCTTLKITINFINPIPSRFNRKNCL